MSYLDVNALKSEISAFMKSPATQKELEQACSIDVSNNAYQAAERFISVLKNEIQSSGLSAGAAGAISQIEHSSAFPTSNGEYIISVYFSGDLSRPSLDSPQYGQINDIVLLFNNGVGHTMRPVHGEWHGHEIWSKTVIPGTHFIESAINSFMSNYASEYGVVNITCDGIG